MRNRAIFSAFLLLAVATLLLSACGFSISTANIKDATLAKGYDNGYAVGPTDAFGAGDLEIHLVVDVANAPDGTDLKAVWAMVDVEGHEPRVLDESPLTLNSGENVAHFVLTNSQLWPVGSYKVDVYLNDKLDRTLKYRISPPTIESATLAKGSDQNEAVDPTSVFSPDDLVIHLVVKVSNAANGTGVRAVWHVVEVEGYEPQVIDESPYTLGDGENVADFTLTNDKPWPVGSYKVELYLADTLVQTLTYEVR